MGAWKALVIEAAYLHDEDAPSLQPLLVRVNDSTVDLTVCGRPMAISLNLDDLQAINALVAEVQQAQGSRLIVGADGGLVLVRETCGDSTGALKDGFDWQPDWSLIPKRYKFIAKDEDGVVWGYTAKPVLDKHIWRIAPSEMHGNYENRLNIDMPDRIDWRDSLRERPDSAWQPDWSQIPIGIKYVAKDADEKAYGYVWEPKISDSDTGAEGYWYCPVDAFACSRLEELDNKIPGDWKASLRKRPAE